MLAPKIGYGLYSGQWSWLQVKILIRFDSPIFQRDFWFQLSPFSLSCINIAGMQGKLIWTPTPYYQELVVLVPTQVVGVSPDAAAKMTIFVKGDLEISYAC